MDSKDKRYEAAVDKALGTFDSVTEWADYISFLSRLHRALQEAHTTSHWVPHDMRISTTLAKCLSPNLPSGVHQKTIEVYNYVFKELGVSKLAECVAIWVPGVLPIVQFASISIKPLVIDLYKNYLLSLPSRTLQNLIKPLLSYLILSIDDERSEYFDVSLQLIDDFRANLQNDSLFWQSLFLIIITSDERRLGCLVWCNRRMPQLNITTSLDDLSEEQRAIVTPESGLLIRAFSHALLSQNILIQRGFFDLLIKNLQLNSIILQQKTSQRDLQKLIINSVYAILKKDMSINRRVWTWLLGPENLEISPVDYFKANGFNHLYDGLLKLINGEFNNQLSSHQKIASFKICLSILDKWEIGSLIIPKVLVPVLKSIETSAINQSSQIDDILKSGNSFIDAVETITIWGNLNKLISNDNINFLKFVLNNFNLQEEEMLVHHYPLFLVSVLIKSQPSDDWFGLLDLLVDIIPQRAFLPIEHSDSEILDLSSKEITSKIDQFYENNDSSSLPFKPADLSALVLNLLNNLIINNLNSNKNLNYIELLTKIIDNVPSLKYNNDEIASIIQTKKFDSDDSILVIAKLFGKISFTSPFVKIKALNNIVSQLCQLLSTNGLDYQVEIVKSLNALTLSVQSNYVEGCITNYLLSLDNFNERLLIFNYIWSHSNDSAILLRPLLIILDELSDKNSIKYSFLKHWILNLIKNGSINRLFHLITMGLSSSIEDSVMFTYHISMILSLIDIDPKSLLQLFKDELIIVNDLNLKDLNISTYKDFTLYNLEKFLKSKKFDSKILNVLFKLYQLLIDNNDSDLNEKVFKIYNLSYEFIINEKDKNAEYEEISILLIDNLKELTKMSINNNKNFKILLVDENEKFPFLIKFLIESFKNFNSQGLLKAWIELLLTTLQARNDIIFKFVKEIILIIISKIRDLYDCGNLIKDEFSIIELLGVLQEVLSLFHIYILAIEANLHKSSSFDPGFFQSVVSGVFSGDNNHSNKDATEQDFINKKIELNNCFESSIKICFSIWKNSDLNLKNELLNHESNLLSVKHQSLKLKHKSKNLLQILYNLETTETIKYLIKLNSIDEYDYVYKLLHVLDNSRPQLTMSCIYKLVNLIIKQNDLTIKPNSVEIGFFLINYTNSLQDDSIEDIYNDTITFLKEVCNDLSGYKLIILDVLKFLSVLTTKLRNSKFGMQKKIKKEMNDIFLKILPSCLNFNKNNHIIKAINSSIHDVDGSTETEVHHTADNENELSEPETDLSLDKVISPEEIYNSISFIIPKLNYILSDNDKQNSVISNILLSLISPIFKSSKSSSVWYKNIKPYQLNLLNLITIENSQSKSVKFLIFEVFNDNNFFKIKMDEITLWNSIIKNWNKLDSNDKLQEYLSKAILTTNNINIFNFQDNEEELRKLNLKRISYLILIEEKDNYINLIKKIFEKLDELLRVKTIENFPVVLTEIFLILRTILLKFSEIHLYDYWTFIYTLLQNFFNNLLKLDDLKKVNIEIILNGCKLLDLLLILKFEDFQEWIFIIDTINAIYKNCEVISLIDKISLRDEFKKKKCNNDLLKFGNSSNNVKRPGLIGINKVADISELKPFFERLSYYNYENIYNGDGIDYEACEEDIFNDLFS